MHTKDERKAKDSIAGGIGSGLLEILFFQGSDTGRKRIQKKEGPFPPIGKGYLNALSRTVFAEAAKGSVLEKVASLYSGTGWGCLYKGAQRGMTLGLQPVLNKHLVENHKNLFTTIFASYAMAAMHTFSGIVLGVFEVLLLPADAMKIKYQTNKATYKGMSILDVARAENLYKGIGWTIGRNITGSTGFWLGGYMMKSYIANQGYAVDSTSHYM